MKLKLDENGHVVVQDGKPVYTHADGSDVAFDAVSTVATITRLNGEAKTHREAKEAAQEKLKAFEGISDPAAALKALETVRNLDDKKLVDAGEVEKVKAAAVKGYEDKINALVKTHADEIAKITGERDGIQSEFDGEKITNAFAGSKFIQDRLTIPADLAKSAFAHQFKIEDGKIVAYDGDKNRILSRARPTEVAGFEEAIERIVEGYARKDDILKGNQQSGSGKKPGGEPKTQIKGKGNFGGSREERQAAIASRFPDLEKA